MSNKVRILVVDDDSGMCETLSAILRIKGYEVDTANDGYQAIKKVKENCFKFVLMDIKMPGMNGVEAYKIIRDEKPNLKVVFMTAYARDDLVQEILKENAVRIFFKPFDIEKLLSLLQDVD